MTTQVPNYTRLTQKEWQAVQDNTEAKYIGRLGGLPTWGKVKQLIDNPNPVTPLQKMAMLVLLVLAIFTAYKTGAIAIPYSNELLEHLSHGQMFEDTRINYSFNLVTFVLFWMLSTPSLIYFKLLSHDPRLVKARKETEFKVDGCMSLFKFLSLEYISPRLPTVITYVSTVWLIVISYQGGGTIFEMFLPVLAEIGLAQLVGDILEQNAAFNRIVSDRLRLEQDKYNARLKNKLDDERVGILSGVMTEALINVQRAGKKPNAFLENATRDEIKSVLQTEYERLTVTDNFIKELGLTEGLKVETPLKPEQTNLGTEKLVPPHGATSWTPETMLRALKMLNANPASYNGSDIKRDFAPGYNATGLWRKEVRNLLAKGA